MEEYTMFMVGRLYSLEIPTQHRLWSVYSVKFQLKPSIGCVCVWTDKADFKLSGIQNTNIKIREKKNVGWLTLLDIKMYYKVKVIKTT